MFCLILLVLLFSRRWHWGSPYYSQWGYPYGYGYGAYPYGAYSHFNPYWRGGYGYGYGYPPYRRW